MFITIAIFAAALTTLLVSANFFTNSAEKLGKYLKLPQFIVGIFIIGIGTSLPELVTGILSVKSNVSEILPGNIIGANISNLLLVTGLVVVMGRKEIQLGSNYIYIDLHFLIGSVFVFYIEAYDGIINFQEAFMNIFIFIVYSIYLIKGAETDSFRQDKSEEIKFPVKHMMILLISSIGIFFGADYTIQSLEKIGVSLSISNEIIALTVLSLGTTLPEIAVNISAVRQGKSEMAIGSILGSCIFNTLMVPSIGSMFGEITVPDKLISFSLPVMAASTMIFYLHKQDKKLSVWEGVLLILIYLLFVIKLAF
ncbi:MAG: sodium:calcium antiporter [Bacteroidia bacterium]